MCASPMEPTSSQFSCGPTSAADVHAAERLSQDAAVATRVEHMPKEIGVLLLAAGMVTGMLPPPPGPFDLSLMVAGGAALWPRGFLSLQDWTRGRFPKVHHAGMSFLARYLDDLERRYPGSTVQYTSANGPIEHADGPADDATMPTVSSFRDASLT